MGNKIENNTDVTQLVLLEDIKEFQGNLKELSEVNYKKLRKSIVENGITMPFHVWEDLETKQLNLLDGHQRHRTLKLMKADGFLIDQVPIVKVKADNWRHAKRILLSMVSQYGKVTRETLYEYITKAEITADDLIGSFDIPEVSLNLDEFKDEFFKDNNTTEPGCDDDDMPEHVEPKTKLGDLYQLGNHRLLCGDSTNIHYVERLMNGERSDITFTSPPYNAGCFGYDGGKDKYKGNLDDRTQDEYFDFLCSFTNICLEISKYVFINNQFLYGNRYAIARYFGQYYQNLKDVFPWIKNTAPPNVNKGVFTNRFEFFLCLEKENSKKGFPVDWQGKYHNIIEGHTGAKENVTEGSHSATMPSYVPEWFFERLPFIKMVYEPFGGSGTTMIACEKTNRKCFMMEIDPHYVSIIIERWCKYTGKDAYLLNEDGTQTAWSEIKAVDK